MSTYLGTYQVNIRKSNFGSYKDTNVYRNVTLTLKTDTTFEFSEDLPFLTQTKGKFRMTGDDIGEWCHLIYDDGSEDQCLRDVNKAIYIKYPRGRKWKKGADLLYLNKIRD